MIKYKLILKILQRNWYDFDYRINDGIAPSFSDCQFYLKRQSKLLCKIGIKIENAFPITHSFNFGSNDELGYYDLIKRFDEEMQYYEDELMLRSIIWRTMPKLSSTSYYKLFYRMLNTYDLLNENT